MLVSIDTSSVLCFLSFAFLLLQANQMPRSRRKVLGANGLNYDMITKVGAIDFKIHKVR